MENENGALPQPGKPTCPKCGAGRGLGENGAPLSMTNLVMGPALCAVIFCGAENCGAIIAVQVLEMSVNRAQPQPLIHRPD